MRELDDLEARGISTAVVRLSGEAHLIMPWHVAIDQAHASGGSATSRSAPRGAASARRTPTRRSRLGIRVQDLLDPKILRQKIEVALAEKNVWLERVYGAEPLELEDRGRALRGLRAAPAAVRRPTRRSSSTGRSAKARFVLLEGAQGTLLDLDHGTYPFVTSSSTVAGGAAVGIGIGPNSDRPRSSASPRPT